jgi:hypothetical protein
LETWRKELSKRFKAIAAFHEVLRHSFNKPVTRFGESYFQFDAVAHRAFIDSNVRCLLNRLSALVAIAVEEMLPQSVVARFQEGWLLCEGSNHLAVSATSIREKLSEACPGGDFHVNVSEITR